LRPSFLLNFSTHKADLALFEKDWQRLEEFVHSQGFDGIELYPVEGLCDEDIPKGLVKGVHLRFFVLIKEIWEEDLAGLEKIFGDLENAWNFYGGQGKATLLETYVEQMNLASTLGCSYVVFHPAHVCIDRVFDWKMDLHWKDTLKISCQIMDQAVMKSQFEGYVLFENLWWPGSFTLGGHGQFGFILSNMAYKRCGIVLDTGHMLLDGGGFENEEEAISYLEERLRSPFFPIKDVVALHLTCTLSGSYAKKTKKSGQRPRGRDFWERFQDARRHVMQLDRHDPFTLPATDGLIRLTRPRYVVFEFSYKDIESWKEKIKRQKKALGTYWP